MKIVDNKIVIDETIKLMKKHNIKKEFINIEFIKVLISEVDKAVDKVNKKKQLEVVWLSYVMKQKNN